MRQVLIYKQRIGAKELLQNNELASVLPQFTGLALQNVYSFKEVRKRVRDYIVGVYGNRVLKVAGNYIWISGKKETVIKQLKELKELVEAFYNATPSIVKNIRRNTKLVLPYESISEIKELKTVQQKITLLKRVLENVTYNPNFHSEGKINIPWKGKDFEQKQKLWKKRVGWKE